MSYANVARFLTDNQGRSSVEALVTPERRLTYGELAAAVDRWGHLLLDLGVKRGDRVVLAVRGDHRGILLMLALAKIGAVAVPANTRWAPPEVAYAVDLCRPALTVADDTFLDLAERALEVSEHSMPLRSAQELEEAADAVGDVALDYADVALDDPLRILFTSGTTSRPKGVVTTHGNSIWNHRVVGLDLGLVPDDRVLVCYPMFHVSGLEAPGVFGTLATGATCLLLPNAHADEVGGFIGEERASGAVLLPPLYSEILEDPARRPDLSSLRWVLTGALTPASAAHFATVLPGRRLIEVFAMTEATGAATVVDETRMPEKAGRTGRAVRNLDVRVVDELGVPVPTGSPGLIELRGPKISPRYWGLEDERRGGWFATGDIGDLDEDGYLSYRGRAKEMIKSGGENVAMAEVERVIVQHPDVFAVSLVRIPDERWGEGLKAFILPESGRSLDAAALSSFCREQLAAFKVPREWEEVADLPFNHSGKVLRRVMQAREDERRGIRRPPETLTSDR